MTQASPFDKLQPAEGMCFESGKTYVHAIGLSCAFRQWRARSHCRFLHGYALQVSFVFQSETLSDENWVVDFGALKSLKGWLEDWFDHKTLVAEDDPELPLFRQMAEHRLIDMKIVPHVGMEACAMFIYHFTEQWLIDNGFKHVTLQSVEVREHDANFGRYKKK